MENKNPKLELEPNRKVYFQLGLFMVSAVTLMAFTYKTPIYLGEKNLVEHEINVPIVFVEMEESPIVEIPKVEKLTSSSPSTPIVPSNFFNDVDPTKNSDDDPKLVITSKTSDPITVLPFSVDPGAAPDLGAIVKYPDYEAQFEGNWLKFLGSELKYPEQSIAFNQSGTAWVSFVVEIDGSITDVQIINKSLATPLQNEAIRVIKASPKWKPGSVNGERVRSNRKVKINFILE